MCVNLLPNLQLISLKSDFEDLAKNYFTEI
jgi:hypothetical protein